LGQLQVAVLNTVFSKCARNFPKEILILWAGSHTSVLFTHT
jgi:hypothetical protein